MSSYVYSLILVGFVNILLGLYSSIGSKKSQSLKYLSFALLAVGLWAIGLGGFLSSNSEEIAICWAKFHYIASIYIVYFVLIFGIALGYGNTATFWKRQLLHIPILAVSVLILLNPKLLLSGVIINEHGNIALMFRLGHLFYALLFTIYYVATLVIVSIKVFRSRGIVQKQYFIQFAGLLSTGILGGTFNLVLPLLGNYQLIWVGPFFTVFFLGFMLLGILKYQLFNIRLLVGKIAFIFLSSLIVYFIFTFFFYFINTMFESYWNLGGVIFGLLSSVLFVVAYDEYRKYVQNGINSKILYPGFEPSTLIQEYNVKIAKITKQSEIADLFVELIKKSIRPEYISIILRTDDGSLLNKQYTEYRDIDYERIFKIVKNLKTYSHDDVISLSQITTEVQLKGGDIDENIISLSEILQENNLHLLLPIRYSSELLALCILGERDANYNIYIEEEIEFLRSTASITGISLIRSFLFDELEKFNETLQDKVDEQTQDLKNKVLELEEARRKERDMVDIMGHELRTPATIVKLNADLLEKYETQVGEDRKSYEKYLFRIKNAINNEIDIINTLLSSAKLEGNRMVINNEEVELYSKVEECISSHKKDASNKGLKLFNKLPKDIPNVYADKSRVLEILHNLVSNAIKYTEKGSISIEGSYNNSNVTIKVIDTGIGISQRDLDRLGEKFYRVNNYTDDKGTDIVRPGGTGLGLYVTFNLVKNMGGSVKVTSELGKGSEFIFSLPRYTGQKSRVIGNNSDNMFEKLGLQR